MGNDWCLFGVFDGHGGALIRMLSCNFRLKIFFGYFKKSTIF